MALVSWLNQLSKPTVFWAKLPAAKAQRIIDNVIIRFIVGNIFQKLIFWVNVNNEADNHKDDETIKQRLNFLSAKRISLRLQKNRIE